VCLKARLADYGANDVPNPPFINMTRLKKVPFHSDGLFHQQRLKPPLAPHAARHYHCGIKKSGT
jgi:hypothetical protein